MNKIKLSCCLIMTTAACSVLPQFSLAGELAVSGGWNMNFYNYTSGTSDSGRSMSGATDFDMSASGALDNGMTLSMSAGMDDGHTVGDTDLTISGSFGAISLGGGASYIDEANAITPSGNDTDWDGHVSFSGNVAQGVAISAGYAPGPVQGTSGPAAGVSYYTPSIGGIGLQVGYASSTGTAVNANDAASYVTGASASATSFKIRYDENPATGNGFGVIVGYTDANVTAKTYRTGIGADEETTYTDIISAQASYTMPVSEATDITFAAGAKDIGGTTYAVGGMSLAYKITKETTITMSYADDVNETVASSSSDRYKAGISSDRNSTWKLGANFAF